MTKQELALYRRIERATTEEQALAVIKAADKLEDTTGIVIGAAIRAAITARIEQLSQARKQALVEEGKRYSLSVGDILSAQYGYGKTDHEFYQVTKVMADSTVELKELAQYRKQEEQRMAGTCEPIKDQFLDSQTTLHLRATARNRVQLRKRVIATPWNGEPLHYSYE